MAEHTDARFLVGASFDLLRDDCADTAKSSLAIGRRVGGRDELAAALAGAFGHDDDREIFSLLCALGNLVANALVAERDFWNKDHIGAASHAGKQCNPTGVAAHHFQDHYALMAFGSGVETIDRVGRASDGRIEAEGPESAFQVVIDCFRYADYRDAVLVKLLRDAQRAVAADGDKSRQILLRHPTLDAV